MMANVSVSPLGSRGKERGSSLDFDEAIESKATVAIGGTWKVQRKRSSRLEQVSQTAHSCFAQTKEPKHSERVSPISNMETSSDEPNLSSERKRRECEGVDRAGHRVKVQKTPSRNFVSSHSNPPPIHRTRRFAIYGEDVNNTIGMLFQNCLTQEVAQAPTSRKAAAKRASESQLDRSDCALACELPLVSKTILPDENSRDNALLLSQRKRHSTPLQQRELCKDIFDAKRSESNSTGSCKRRKRIFHRDDKSDLERFQAIKALSVRLSFEAHSLYSKLNEAISNQLPCQLPGVAKTLPVGPSTLRPIAVRAIDVKNPPQANSVSSQHKSFCVLNDPSFFLPQQYRAFKPIRSSHQTPALPGQGEKMVSEERLENSLSSDEMGGRVDDEFESELSGIFNGLRVEEKDLNSWLVSQIFKGKVESGSNIKG